jgi:hypothetical protein
MCRSQYKKQLLPNLVVHGSPDFPFRNALFECYNRICGRMGLIHSGPAIPTEKEAFKMRSILTLVLLFSGLQAEQEKPVFLSHYAEMDAEPSADPDAPFWAGIQGVTIDKSVLGPAVPQYRAEVRSRWTKNYIYFLFAGPYQKLTLNDNPDTVEETYRMWEKDCFEVYLGADFEQINRYREFQMSPAGEFLDLDIDSSRPKPGFNGEQNWDAGMKVKARIDESRKFWYGEMKIPIAAVDSRPAAAGNEMRINLFRQDDEPPNRKFLAWQPPGVWNPHHPDKFGILRLVQ